MSTPIDLSIIVVNWNTKDLTLECLRSVYAEAQNSAFEVLVVDNGSSDGSAKAIAAEFPQARLFAETENHGFASANNIAAMQAKGTRILLLNSDTVVLDHGIDRLLTFANRTPKARIWGGRTEFADGTLNPQSAWGRVTLWSSFCFASGLMGFFPRSPLFNSEGLADWNRQDERAVDIVSGCFFLIDRDLWQQLDGFDPLFFMYGEEADLCARARKLGAAPRVSGGARIIHYGGGSTNSADMNSFLFGARIELAQRSLSPMAAALTRIMLLAGTGLRAVLYMMTARAVSARLWRTIWQRRKLWLSGPISAQAARHFSTNA